MRSFSLINLIFFVGLYFILALTALKSIKKITNKRQYGFIRNVIMLVHFAILACFILLYLYPRKPGYYFDYHIYSYFNAILFIIFIVNIPLSFSLIFTYIFKFKQRSNRIIPYMGFIISNSIGLVMLYGTFFGVKEINVNHINIYFNDLPQGFHNYKIVQISDIHFGNSVYSEKIIEKTNKKIENIDFDLLLFTGDIVNNFSNELNGCVDIFRKFTTGRQCYSVLGNHDYGDYMKWDSEEKKQENFNEIVSYNKQLGFNILRNEHVVIKNKGDSIFLIGTENWGHPPFPQYADLSKAMYGIPQGAFTILMTHDPAHWESKVNGKRDINLTLSGHSHGLQWGIKPAGITFSLAYLTLCHWGGLYDNENGVLNVNTGLGTVGVPWRIDMPAEITVLTLKSVCQ
jgi:uncharacterized protein